jgi:hypothetical protein
MMEEAKYCILLGLGSQNEKMMHCLEKDFKLYVLKQFHEDYPEAFSLNFYHIDDQAEFIISQDELPAFMAAKGITKEDCHAAASWYVLKCAKLEELRYDFPILNLECGPAPHIDDLLDEDGNPHDYVESFVIKLETE